MSDFDALMADADLSLYAEFGDAATLTRAATVYPDLTVVMDKNVEVLVEGYIQLIDWVASINAAPVRPTAGDILTVGATGYRVNRYLDSDGFTTRVAVIPQ
jgi:hypothetical protein